MGVRVTRGDGAPAYAPPLHHGVGARRLQGLEAGATDRFWVGLSVYEPGGGAETAPTPAETVYVVLDGELELRADDRSWTLRPHDSAHLPAGTVRSVRNLTGSAATLLVVIATPSEVTS